MRITTALLALGLAATASAATIYLNDGTSVETDDNIYVSKEKVYTVHGSLAEGLSFKPVQPVRQPEPTEPAPVDICDSPRPSGTITFELIDQQQQWDKECGPAEPEYVPDCEGPRPPFDGTFESIDRGWIYDNVCGQR